MPRGEAGPDSWILYRREVDEAVREEIRDKLLTAKVNGFEDFLDVSMGIVSHLLAGDIHPDVAKEARSYLELCLTAVTAKTMKDRSGGAEAGSVTARIARANKARGALPAPTAEVTIDVTSAPTRVPAAPWENE